MDQSSDQNRNIKDEIIELDDDDELDQRATAMNVKKEEKSAGPAKDSNLVTQLLEQQMEYRALKEKEWQDKEKRSSNIINELRKKVAKLEQNEVNLKEEYQRYIRTAEREKNSLKDLIDNKPVVIENSKMLTELKQKVEILTNQLEEERTERRNAEQKVAVLTNQLEEERYQSNQRIDELTSMLAKSKDKEGQTTSNDTPNEAMVNGSTMDDDLFTTGVDEDDNSGEKEKIDEETEEGEGPKSKVVVGERKRRARVIVTRASTSSIVTRSISNKTASSLDRPPKKRGSRGVKMEMDALPPPPLSPPSSVHSQALPSLPTSSTPSTVDGISVPVAVPSIAETQLISTISEVCKEKKTVEEAMKELLPMKMRVNTIAECFSTALIELPLSNTWDIVQAKMAESENDRESKRLNGFVPKEEKKFFELLKAVRDTNKEKFVRLIDIFHNEYRDKTMSTRNKSTAEVTRNVRCLLFALVRSSSEKSQLDKEAAACNLFHDILTKQSSEAVCQSMVYLLLCHQELNSYARAILKFGVDNKSPYSGHLIAMHMNVEDAKVVDWALKKVWGKEHGWFESVTTPATLGRVLKWWNSDMEELEKARKGFVRTGQNGIEFGKQSAFIVRMAELIYAKTNIEGLDRVKLLKQLINPAINALDRSTSSTLKLSGFDSPIAYIDASEGRVVIFKIEVAIAALKGYEDRICDVDQSDLRSFLATSIEKINKILERSLCKKVSNLPSSSSNEDKLPLIITNMKEWVKEAENLMKKHSMETPAMSNAESSPVRKRARREEDSKDQ